MSNITLNSFLIFELLILTILGLQSLKMMIPDYPTSPLHCQAYCKKDILVRGDMTEEMSDIVEKFIKVAHGPEALEDNRARENARENIRQVLYIALMLVLVN